MQIQAHYMKENPLWVLERSHTLGNDTSSIVCMAYLKKSQSHKTNHQDGQAQDSQAENKDKHDPETGVLEKRGNNNNFYC